MSLGEPREVYGLENEKYIVSILNFSLLIPVFAISDLLSSSIQEQLNTYPSNTLLILFNSSFLSLFLSFYETKKGFLSFEQCPVK